MVFQPSPGTVDELLHRGVGTLRVTSPHGVQDGAVEWQAEVQESVQPHCRRMVARRPAWRAGPNVATSCCR